MASPRQIVDLVPYRADQWYEGLHSGSPEYLELCELMGDRFAAFSIISGAQVTSIVAQGDGDSEPMVEFSVQGVEGTNRAHLTDFRRRVADSVRTELLRRPRNTTGSTSKEESEVYRCLPPVAILLAPVFDMTLLRLHFGGGDDSMLEFTDAAGTDVDCKVGDFLEGLLELVQREMSVLTESAPSAIDLSVVPEVQKAAEREDHDRVIQLIGMWPGPLSMLIRSPQGAQLDEQVRSLVCNALAVLCRAYFARDQPEWAMEILRLALHWARGMPAMEGPLFYQLGEMARRNGQFGQAIGHFRRAESLGVAFSDLYLGLASCFVERGKYVAARVCLEADSVRGVPEAQDLIERCDEVLGDAWRALVAHRSQVTG